MNKKILAAILLLNLSFAAWADTSTNSFNLTVEPRAIPGNPAPAPLSSTPPDSGGDGSGLSGRAVAGIVLGSVGGLVVLAAVLSLLDKTGSSTLSALPYYLAPLCFDDASFSSTMHKDNDNPYLKTALKTSGVDKDFRSKYILVDDTTLDNHGNVAYYFEIPRGTTAIKMTQVSDSLAGEKVNALNALVYTNVHNQKSWMSMTQTISKEQEGIVQKVGQVSHIKPISTANEAAALVIKYNSSKSRDPSIKVAYVLEFIGSVCPGCEPIKVK